MKKKLIYNIDILRDKWCLPPPLENLGEPDLKMTNFHQHSI